MRAGCMLRGMVVGLIMGMPLLLGGTTASAQPGNTAILDRIRVTGRRPIDFHAIILPDTVFVGQQATYQVAVMLSQDAKSRLRRNPEFLPPDLRGLLAYELGVPVRADWRQFGDNVYESHIFQRALFPVAAGWHAVPAPQLSYALPQSSSYFSREERFVVKAESAQLVVAPLPLEGRPDDFNGAVGVLTTIVRIDSTNARVGDPLNLTMRVRGTGNVKLLPRPHLEMSWASVVPGSERVTIDSSGPLIRGTKEFDWILTPARDGAVTVPALRYSYFNPYTRLYEVAESEPVAMTVRPGTLVDVLDDESGALLPLRAVGVPRNATRWFGHAEPSALGWLALLLALLAPVPALASVLRRRTHSDAGVALAGVLPVRTAQDVDQGSPRALARSARRTLLDRLAMRFDMDAQSLVSRRHVARLLRRGGVTRATTSDVLSLLGALDEQGFGMGHNLADSPGIAPIGAESRASAIATGVGMWSKRVDEIMQRIDAEAMPRGRRVGTRRARPVVILVGALLGSAGIARHAPLLYAQSATPSATQAAADAYAQRGFTEAAQRFAALAAAYPRDPDLLANWGTAAWALGDTVSAVIAWQRAARLEPMAMDLHEQLLRLPSGARGGVASVPMVPVTLLTIVALIGWFVGWGILWLWTKRRSTGSARPWMTSAAVITLLLSATAGAIAWWGVRALDISQLAVVSRPETMRVAPGVDADALGGVSTGDVVRVLEQRDLWDRVHHADGRSGWLPATRLVTLRDSVNGALDGPTDSGSNSTRNDSLNVR